MSLKDSSELVKMYAMVNVSQYQIVATGTSVMDCETNYRAMLARSGLIGETQAELTPAEELHTRTGVIEEIRTAVIDGNSYYYLRFAGESAFSVRASAARIPYAPMLSVGDRVTVHYRDTDVGQYWTDAYDVYPS